MSEATSETGALTVDAAIESLLAPPTAEQEAPEAPVEAASEPEEIAAEASPAEEAAEGAESPAEGEPEGEAAEPAETPLDPPLYWKPEAKEAFSKLDPALQAEILAQEGPREESARKAKAEAAAEREAATKEIKGVQTLAAQLADFLPQAVQTFQSKWGAQEPNWAEVATEHGADQAFILKSQFEAEQRLLVQTAQATQEAQKEAHKAFVQTEWKALAEIAPDLAPDPADPTKGAEKRQGVVKYLSDNGIPQEAIAQISAREMSLAHKAMLWDQAQTALKAAPRPKPAVPAPRATVRPSAAVAAPSTHRTAQAASNRFAQTRSVDDAVALLLASKA